MTLLENLIVAQHNALMPPLWTLGGLLGLRSFRVAQSAAVERACYWLENVGLLERADDAAGDLPYGAQRRLEIARAMCTQPELLCLDEPAAGLNPRESAELIALLENICRVHGLSILLIEHDMAVVMEISDHVVVLDWREKISGRHARPSAEGRPKVIAAYLGRPTRRWRRDRTGAQQEADSEAVAGDSRRSRPTMGIQALKGVDLEVHAGEIVTLIGANGAGKSTLMMTICGTPRARDGRIVFDGTDITRMPTHEIMRMAIAQSPEGRRIFPRMTVLENLQMGGHRPLRAFRRGPGARVPGLPAARALPAAARRHAFGRRAADAGDRPRADEPPEAAPAGRALAGVGAASGEADLHGDQDAQRERQAHRPAGGAERLSRAQARAPGYVMVTGAITLSGTGRELLAREEVRKASLEGARR
jgi:ABC-type branched-subunit amino acid transport system ATPase component